MHDANAASKREIAAFDEGADFIIFMVLSNYSEAIEYYVSVLEVVKWCWKKGAKMYNMECVLQY